MNLHLLLNFTAAFLVILFVAGFTYLFVIKIKDQMSAQNAMQQERWAMEKENFANVREIADLTRETNQTLKEVLKTLKEKH